jgi:hypothetical protein
MRCWACVYRVIAWDFVGAEGAGAVDERRGKEGV